MLRLITAESQRQLILPHLPGGLLDLPQHLLPYRVTFFLARFPKCIHNKCSVISCIR